MPTQLVPQVAVIDFNHHRGPEIELWLDEAGQKIYDANDWGSLPFLALPDGAHAVEEEFSYFTLLAKSDGAAPGTEDGTGELQPDGVMQGRSIFGVSCTRQLRADKLLVRSPEVTRSTVQKAVVVLAEKPSVFVNLRDRLASITAAWFAQADFTNVEILKAFQTSLTDAAARPEEKHHYFGLSLRDLLHELRYQTLVLFKCILLQKRVLFFGTKCERLCMTQFALVSLIPGLLDHLEDCASPELATPVDLTQPTALKTSDRASILAYMGLPLCIFGSSSFFSPYTPLQQLDLLASSTSKSYVAGSTNTLFLAQKDLRDPQDSNKPPQRFCDVLVNLDEPSLNNKVTILDPDLRSALSLSAADRRWIDALTSTVLETWNPKDPSRPTTHGYSGSEDAIRLAFEEYILSLLSSTSYSQHYDNNPNPYLGPSGVTDERFPDPSETSADFNADFLRLWRETPNHALWRTLTKDAVLFDLVKPCHPTAGGLNIDDVQRRVGAAVAELHLDERTRQARESAGKAIELGREKVGAGVARFWKEVESFRERREQSRSRDKDGSPARSPVDGVNEGADEAIRPSLLSRTSSHRKSKRLSLRSSSPSNRVVADASATVSTSPDNAAATSSWTSRWRDTASKVQRPNIPVVDTTQVSAAAKENAAKAGAWVSSWGSWARERGREWSQGNQGATADATSSDAMGRDPGVQGGLQRQVSMGAVAAARSVMSESAPKGVEKVEMSQTQNQAQPTDKGAIPVLQVMQGQSPEVDKDKQAKDSTPSTTTPLGI